MDSRPGECRTGRSEESSRENRLSVRQIYTTTNGLFAQTFSDDNSRRHVLKKRDCRAWRWLAED
jgi:hypothetical protein